MAQRLKLPLLIFTVFEVDVMVRYLMFDNMDDRT
jgi:hypothetical protein